MVPQLATLALLGLGLQAPGCGTALGEQLRRSGPHGTEVRRKLATLRPSHPGRELSPGRTRECATPRRSSRRKTGRTAEKTPSTRRVLFGPVRAPRPDHVVLIPTCAACPDTRATVQYFDFCQRVDRLPCSEYIYLLLSLSALCRDLSDPRNAKLSLRCVASCPLSPSKLSLPETTTGLTTSRSTAAWDAPARPRPRWPAPPHREGCACLLKSVFLPGSFL